MVEAAPYGDPCLFTPIHAHSHGSDSNRIRMPRIHTTQSSTFHEKNSTCTSSLTRCDDTMCRQQHATQQQPRTIAPYARACGAPASMALHFETDYVTHQERVHDCALTLQRTRHRLSTSCRNTPAAQMACTRICHALKHSSRARKPHKPPRKLDRFKPQQELAIRHAKSEHTLRLVVLRSITQQNNGVQPFTHSKKNIIVYYS